MLLLNVTQVALSDLEILRHGKRLTRAAAAEAEWADVNRYRGRSFSIGAPASSIFPVYRSQCF